MAYALRHAGTGLKPAAEDIVTLPYVDRWLIWCIRRLCEAQRHDDLPCPMLDGAFAAAGQSAAGTALYALSALICGRGHRAPDVRVPQSRRVSTDERAFLRLLAALQRGDDATADAILRRWLPASERCRARAQAALVAQSLARGGYWARSCTEPIGTWQRARRRWLN